MSRRIVTLIATALGLALLFVQVESIGVSAIVDGLKRLGPTGAGLILGTSLLRQLFRTLAWTLMMDASVPFLTALGATMSGDAIGNLTPLSLLVSEPAKAMYVGAHVPPQRALAALAAETFFYSLSVAIAVLFGVAVLFLEFAVSEPLRTISLMFVAGMAAVLVGALWLIAKEPALVSATMARLSRFAGTRASAYVRLVEKIRDMETSSYAFVRSRPGRLAAVIACEFGFHVFSIAETWIMLIFLGFHSLALAIALDTAQRMVNVVFKIVPLKIGVDEAGSGFVSSALGAGPALGVTMALVRKIRVVVWSGLGVLLNIRRA